MILIAAACIGVFIGWLATVVGGAGLIAIPALMVMGLSAPVAIATNKLSAVVIMFVGVWRFSKFQRIDWRIAASSTVFAAGGAYFGAVTLLSLPENLLELLVGIVLAVFFFLLLLQPKKGTQEITHTSLLSQSIGAVLFFPLGFWGSFFGGGFGLLAVATYVLLCGCSYLDAAMLKFIPGIIIAVVSIGIFVSAEMIDYRMAFALGLGNGVGAYYGPKFAVLKGNEWLRKAVLVLVGASALHFLFIS